MKNKRTLLTPFPKFENNVVALSGNQFPVSFPVVPYTGVPVLHDRLFPSLACPGINESHNQAQNLFLALPFTERSGLVVRDYSTARRVGAVDPERDYSYGSYQDNFDSGDRMPVEGYALDNGGVITFYHSNSTNPYANVDVVVAYNVSGITYTGMVWVPNMGIPKGSTITSCTYSGHQATSGGGVPVIIQGFDYPEDGDILTILASASWTDMMTYPRTTATVAWNFPAANGTITTDDFSSVLQELVDRDDWTQYNSFLFFFFPQSSAGNSTGLNMMDGDNHLGTGLNISYKPPVWQTDDFLGDVYSGGKIDFGTVRLPSAKGFSVCFWFNATVAFDDMVIMELKDGSTVNAKIYWNAEFQELGFRLGTDTYQQFSFQSDISGWHHYTFIAGHNGTYWTGEIYEDAKHLDDYLYSYVGDLTDLQGNLTIGADNNGDQPANGCFKDFRIYTCPLIYGQVVEIMNHGEQLYEPPNPMLQALEAPETWLEGTITGQTNLTGDMYAKMIAGSIDGQSSVNGGISVNYALAGGINGQSSFDATINAAKYLEGSIDGQSTVGGDTLGFGIAGGITGTSNIDADLRINRFVVGPITPVVTVGSSILTIESRMSGSITGQSVVAAPLRINRHAIGSIDGTTNLADSTIYKKRGMTGAITGQSATSGEIDGNIALTGQVSGTVAITAQLSIDAALSGAITNQTSTVGDLTNHEAVRIAGGVSGSTNVSGSMGLKNDLVGSIEATIQVEATLYHYQHIAGSIAGSSSVAGAINPRLGLNGSITGTSSTGSILERSRGLAGGIDWTASIGGTINTAEYLEGQIDWTASIGGDVSNHVGLAGGITGASSIDSDLYRQTKIDGGINGQSSIAGAIRLDAAIAGLINPQSTVAARLGGQFYFAGSINGSSNVAANMQYRPTPISSEILDYLRYQISAELYPLVLPMNVQLPAIAYSRSNSEFNYYLSSPAKLRTTTMSFDIFATSQEEAIDLSNELTDALHGYTGDMGSIEVKNCEIDNVDDAYFYIAGENSQGIIRTVDVIITHNHRIDWINYNYTDEEQLKTWCETYGLMNASFNAGHIETRPTIIINRTGPGLNAYVEGQEQLKNNGDHYLVTIQAEKYSTVVETAEILRLSLGNSVDNLYDSFDFDATGKPIFETNLELIC